MLQKQNLIDTEVLGIIDNATPYVIPTVAVIIHTESMNMTVGHLQTYRTECNYNTDISDIIFIDFMIPMGTFIRDIYAQRDSLEVTIEIKTGTKKVKNKYKGTILNKLPTEYNSTISNLDMTELDKQDMFECNIQCIDPLTLALKNKITSGIYHDITLTKLLKGILSHGLKDITVIGKKLIYNLNIYKSDNDQVFNNIIIKPFTKIIKLPYELQHNSYGLYKGDIGIYFSKLDTTTLATTYDIYIYPLFNYERYEEELDLPRLLLINPNLPNVTKNDNNAFYDVNTYKIAISEISFNDINEHNRYNEGNGVISIKKDLFNDKSLVNVTDTKITFKSDETFDYHNDNRILDYAKYIEINQKENEYIYYSNINKNKSVLATIKLPNINSEVLIPGMAVKYMFLEKDKVVTTTGILQGCNRSYDMVRKVSISILFVSFKRIEKGVTSV